MGPTGSPSCHSIRPILYLQAHWIFLSFPCAAPLIIDSLGRPLLTLLDLFYNYRFTELLLLLLLLYVVVCLKLKESASQPQLINCEYIWQ